MRRLGLRLPRSFAILAICLGVGVASATGQSKTIERTFPESPAAVQKILQKMQTAMSGHLPTLDGFAIAGNRPFERYQRAYFQATAKVTPSGMGKATVLVSVKVTAWYDDPQKSHSGYELLVSNGRIENDILDQLSEELAAGHPNENGPSTPEQKPDVAQAVQPILPPKTTDAAISAPQPRLFDSPSVSSSLSRGIAEAAKGDPEGSAPPKAADPERTRLQDEISQLQEALKNQSHPKNMAAVKKSGTAVVSTPSLSAKPIFLATAHDEFEILNYNQDWVHVRISGISRGWIWRNDLEMPDIIPDTPTAPSSPRSAEIFHVVREEMGQFPGDWEPLRGKNVKLVTVQKIDESTKDADRQVKLDFAKDVFDKTYAEIAQKSPDLAGVVLIFDSADGGMIAAPQATLAKWKSGVLSDSAFWRNCYFDPPETFSSGGSSASQ